MVFIAWLAKIIAAETVKETGPMMIEFLEKYCEGLRKIDAISLEAKDLLGELDAAQSDVERKAILRKLTNYSDFGRLILK